MTDERQRQSKRRGLYIAARPDFDFLTPLRRAAKMVDRTPAHFARQLIVHGLYQLGEISDEDERAPVRSRPRARTREATA